MGIGWEGGRGREAQSQQRDTTTDDEDDYLEILSGYPVLLILLSAMSLVACVSIFDLKVIPR